VRTGECPSHRRGLRNDDGELDVVRRDHRTGSIDIDRRIRGILVDDDRGINELDRWEHGRDNQQRYDDRGLLIGRSWGRGRPAVSRRRRLCVSAGMPSRWLQPGL
jgi:hypothetical protein